MKIRTQFYWLIAGIVIMPIIMMFAIGLLGYVYVRGQDTVLVPGYREVESIAGKDINEKDWKEITEYIARSPRFFDHVVLDRSRTVLYSTIPKYPSKTKISDAELAALLWKSDDKYHYQSDVPKESGTSQFLVIKRIPVDSNQRFDPFLWMLRYFLIILFVIFAFSTTMSAIIARSITRSVMLLEEKTRRIAEGELDVEIDAKGSNEITSLTVSLNRMRLALKEDQARRSRFIMGISHDLKTPLALIKGYAEAISDGLADDPEMMKKSLAIVGGKVDQLEGMIDDLIGFVKLNTDEWRHQLRRQPVAPILRDFAKRIASDGNLLNRKIECDISVPDNIAVPIDERLFLRALENITTNAIRYTREGGLVRISASADEKEMRISVEDDGVGIRQEDIPHIFDLFYRGSNSRREEGMGLGLAVVKSVADSHGWKIGVASEQGKGSAFTITIPMDGEP
jgi:signal transduction histidine kinase